MPGADIVHRQPDPDLPREFERGAPLLAERLPLRYLANKTAEIGCQVKFSEHAAHRWLAECRSRPEYRRRHVHADVKTGVAFEQWHRVATDHAQQSPHQAVEQTRIAFDLLDDRADRTRLAVGVDDPQQRLETSNSAGIEIDNRLVVHGRALQHPLEIQVH